MVRIQHKIIPIKKLNILMKALLNSGYSLHINNQTYYYYPLTLDGTCNDHMVLPFTHLLIVMFINTNLD